MLLVRRARIVPAAFLFAALTSALAAPAAKATGALPAQGSLQAAFTPWDDVEGLIIGALDQAREQVLVQAYLLTSKKIATALVAARRRGVAVEVLLDGKQLEKLTTSVVPRLVAADIPVWLETDYQNAHNKVIVIDAGMPTATVITGSFNFTWTAQHKNAENVLIARENPTLAARYAANWVRHKQASTPFR